MADRTAEQRFGRRIAMGNFLRSKKSRRLPASLSRDALHTPPIPPPGLYTKQGAGGTAPAGGTGGVPLSWKTSEGGAGGMAAQAKPDPPSRLCHTPIAK